MEAKRRTLGFACLSLAWLVSLSACTQNFGDPLADVPPPDELRFIGVNDASSKCIDDPKTPLCAVETLMACFARHELDLCKKVGIVDLSFAGNPYTSRYRVLSSNILTVDDMTEELKDAEWWKPGFAHIDVYRSYFEDGSCPDECRYGYNAKPVGDKWEIVSWSRWGEQDPDDPGPGH